MFLVIFFSSNMGLFGQEAWKGDKGERIKWKEGLLKQRL
jgi:hypothetical protein